MQHLQKMKLLLVDDNATNIELMEQLLAESGYTSVLSTKDPTGVAHLCEAWQPDLVLLDLHMPVVSGFDVMAEIRHLMDEPESLPVLVLTADSTPEARHRALALGARDFVTKPIDSRELLLRTNNVLQTRFLQLQLQEHNASLEAAVRQRTHDLEQARLQSLTLLAAVGEFHDDETYEHTQRVGRLAARVASSLCLPAAIVEDIRLAAPLHDIGKIGVTRQILRKPAPLSEEERSTMKRHTVVGAQILAMGKAPLFDVAATIARSHHERWNGEGYPDRLAGDQIPLAGRITAVADVFDALTHTRPYKPAWDVDRALEFIRSEAGQHFDPKVAEAFLAIQAADRSPITTES